MLLFVAFDSRFGERYIEPLTLTGADPGAAVHLWMLERLADGCSGFETVMTAQAVAMVEAGAATPFKW